MKNLKLAANPALCRKLTCAAALLFELTTPAWAADQPGQDAADQASTASDQAAQATPENWAIHGQSTFTDQFHPAFRSPFEGPQSLSAGNSGRETLDVTLYLGARPWSGAEIWFNPEIDQGFGLGNTFGVAGYLSGEAYKVGAEGPYYLTQRLFFRQTIDLGGETEAIDPGQNQLGGTQTANRLVFTAGKFSVVDIFDTNRYAHDPRGDFLNWSVIDEGAFDYAANSWGYTYGAAAEWYQDWWAIRAGIFDLSETPNGKNLDPASHSCNTSPRSRSGTRSGINLESSNFSTGSPAAVWAATKTPSRWARPRDRRRRRARCGNIAANMVSG